MFWCTLGGVYLAECQWNPPQFILWIHFLSLYSHSKNTSVYPNYGISLKILKNGIESDQASWAVYWQEKTPAVCLRLYTWLNILACKGYFISETYLNSLFTKFFLKKVFSWTFVVVLWGFFLLYFSSELLHNTIGFAGFIGKQATFLHKGRGHWCAFQSLDSIVLSSPFSVFGKLRLLCYHGLILLLFGGECSVIIHSSFRQSKPSGMFIKPAGGSGG